MSLWRRKGLGLGLGAQEIVVLASEEGRNARLMAQLPLADYLAGAHSAETSNWEPPVAAALAQAQGDKGDLHVTVADEWSRYWMVSPPEGLSSLAELRALAASRFESLYGGSAEQWSIEGDWQLSGALLACAIPVSLQDSLRTVAKSQGWNLRSVVPSAVRFLNAHSKEFAANAWVCCFSSQGFLAVLLIGGHIKAARQFRFEQVPDADEVLVRLQSEVLRSGGDMPSHAYFVGNAPSLPIGYQRGGVTFTVWNKLPATVVGAEPGPLSEGSYLALCGVLQ